LPLHLHQLVLHQPMFFFFRLGNCMLIDQMCEIFFIDALQPTQISQVL
jgi:hypothetical protein